MIERDIDYSPADDRAWREAQERWSAREAWHPDPMGRDDVAWVVARALLILVALAVIIAVAGVATDFYVHASGALGAQ